MFGFLECGVVFDNGLVDLKEKGMSREVVLEHLTVERLEPNAL